jgi:ATP-binding cassette subfamily B (MDR/TAP) protein 1
MSSAWKGKFSI